MADAWTEGYRSGYERGRKSVSAETTPTPDQPDQPDQPARLVRADLVEGARIQGQRAVWTVKWVGDDYFVATTDHEDWSNAPEQPWLLDAVLQGGNWTLAPKLVPQYTVRVQPVKEGDPYLYCTDYAGSATKLVAGRGVVGRIRAVIVSEALVPE